ncbi:hypothetical protein [Fibrella aquatica]|uniref:hypothetical protein n=1 Tax=Fibrella aquatica TaxID=3242487 RepID=UPI00352201D8
MNRSSTLKTVAWNFIWVLIFLGSVSAVTTIRQRMRETWQADTVKQTLASDAVQMARFTRNVLVP